MIRSPTSRIRLSDVEATSHATSVQFTKTLHRHDKLAAAIPPVLALQLTMISPEVVAGLTSGFVSTLATHPLDTVKVFMQGQNEPMGTFKATRELFRQDGLRALYRGIVPPLASRPMMHSIGFGSMSYFRKIFGNETTFKPQATIVAGGATGMVVSLMQTPIELVKIIQQTLGGRATSYQSLRIAVQNSPLGLWQGLAPTALRNTKGYAGFFLAADVVQEYNRRHEFAPARAATLVAGGCAGVLSSALSMPADLIKTRIQMSAVEGTPQYSSMLHCARIAYQEGGAQIFWAGLRPTIARNFLASAIVLLIYEETMNILTSLKQKQYLELP
eukprot:Clim_evm37s207 gene=Clim_evmTU37s207